LSELSDLSKVVLFREREFLHRNFTLARFVFADGSTAWYERDNIPGDLKFNPDLPEEEKCLYCFYYRSENIPRLLLILILVYLIWPLKKKKENPSL